MNGTSTRGNLATMETLEDRRLLCGDGTEPVRLDGGNLIIKGTQAADTVVISACQWVNTTTQEDGSTVTTTIPKIKVMFNGQQYLFHADQVKHILANGMGGNDSIAVDESNGPVNVRMDLIGGMGHDTLIGGDNNDRIYGDWGCDSMCGGGGADVICGGGGADSISGDEGDDKLEGGLGNDSLDGGAGDDRLFGQEGNDCLTDAKGTDSLFGGVGKDTFACAAKEVSREIKDQRGDDGDSIFAIRKNDRARVF